MAMVVEVDVIADTNCADGEALMIIMLLFLGRVVLWEV